MYPNGGVLKEWVAALKKKTHFTSKKKSSQKRCPRNIFLLYEQLHENIPIHRHYNNLQEGKIKRPAYETRPERSMERYYLLPLSPIPQTIVPARDEIPKQTISGQSAEPDEEK
ncbi:hypothetical protein NPIL_156171 [Nephila pilipes]|uniref:Uncharacterized protein n=1 Tax=Nephila pilipes TaxID=299642 RepID=A0A8X6MLF8_NEPPI|nr:hypothetical protein NPIL_156171 [Nephila pilipes]